MAEKYKKIIIRLSGNINPWVILFTDAQIHAYSDICRRDIIYFDATGSVLKNSSEGKQYQIYNLVIRNPYEGGPALSVATFISSCHDSIINSHFINEFLKAVTKKCGPKNKPIMIMIDGSMAMWNSAVGAFCGENRIQYYERCWRVVTGKASLT